MPARIELSQRCRWFSLSPRERAGVRGNRAHAVSTVSEVLSLTASDLPRDQLLSPFPLSSGAEERGMKFSRGISRVALGDSLTRGYFL
jgi:hypothetical protein